MSTTNKEKYIVVSNQRDGVAVIEYQRTFSSAIPFSQIYSDGLDLTYGRGNILPKSDLDRYEWYEFTDKDTAIQQARTHLESDISGTSSVLDP